MNLVVAQNKNLVSVKKGEPVTTSLIVAKYFNKRHDDVTKAIKRIVSRTEDEEHLRNFAEVFYVDEYGRQQPMFYLTQEGFSFVAMGFTGKKADKFKWAFIEEFKRMERALATRTTPEWKQARIEGKTGRRVLTDVVRLFIDYARKQGSHSPERYYVNYTKMIQSFVSKEKRDDMSAASLVQMNAAEQIAAGLIIEGMEKDLFYKDIFQMVKPVLDNMLRIWNLPKVRFLEKVA